MLMNHLKELVASLKERASTGGQAEAEPDYEAAVNSSKVDDPAGPVEQSAGLDFLLILKCNLQRRVIVLLAIRRFVS